jgi:NADH-quinone oxidoreductase subunit N
LIPAAEPLVLHPSVLAPFGIVAIGALVVLLAEVMLGRRGTVLGRTASRAWVGTVLAGISSLFLFVALVVAMQFFISLPQERMVFDPANPMVCMDHLTAFATALVCIGSIFTCWLSASYLAELRINYGEYYALLLLASSGMILLVQAVDLMTVFLGIELMSIPIYAMAGFARRDLKSNESALKYFLIGSFTSAILLYGMALLYGATGVTDFVKMRGLFDAANPLALVGLGLLVVGFGFKVAAVPFHQWAPDVYEGSPTVVTSYMAVTVKVAAFVALLRILVMAFGPLDARLSDLFWTLSALSIVVGNVMAVIQDNVKRMLAYSSVANAGYMLMGFAVGTPAAHQAVLYFLMVYLFMNVGAFAVVISLAHGGRDRDRFEDFAGLSRTRPALAALLTLFVVAQAGLPATGGFIAKFTMFSAAVQSGFVWLSIIAVLGSAVSFYYYLRLPVLMYMREPEGEAPRLDTSTGEGLVLLICAIAIILLGIFPDAGPGIFSYFRALDWVKDSIAFLG